MFDHQWKISTIQQQARSLISLSMRITCSPCTFGITVNALTNKFTKFFLSVGKKLFFCHNKKTIVFLPYFFNIKTQNYVLTSFMTSFRCNECNESVMNYLSSTIRLNHTHYSFTLITPFFEKKIILKKYGENTMWNVFCWLLMGFYARILIPK